MTDRLSIPLEQDEYELLRQQEVDFVFLVRLEPGNIEGDPTMLWGVAALLEKVAGPKPKPQPGAAGKHVTEMRQLHALATKLKREVKNAEQEEKST